jgi:hypothetical protein
MNLPACQYFLVDFTWITYCILKCFLTGEYAGHKDRFILHEIITILESNVEIEL